MTLRVLYLPAALLLLGVLSIGPACASIHGDLFDEGNTAYEDGRFEEAVTSYEKILQYGLHDPRVHYNLGNAYFKMRRLGSAILHYERALRLDPSDGDVRENLIFARGQIRDRIPEPEMPYPIRAFTTVLGRSSLALVTVIFLIFYLATGALVGALGVYRSLATRRVLGYVTVSLGLCAALSGAALYYKVMRMTAEEAIVVEDRIDVRSGPARDNTVLFSVHEGTRVEIRNRLDGWIQVSLPNALSGWVPDSGIEQV